MQKLLVANRSEIATRVFRAATELGLGTVAVYTHEDRFSLHRFKADESYLIGPVEGGEPVRGYLNIENIIAVAKEHGVDAIHPGYGFLSENAAFSKACQDNDITFVGPTPELLEMFGDKTAAKHIADQAKVPTIPGTEHGLKSVNDVKKAAKEIGYPIIIKASFGGGGRGMRVVQNADELAGKLEEAQREAGAAFGRPEVFNEVHWGCGAPNTSKCRSWAMHTAISCIFGSGLLVQRRHQKVVEVAPSINLPQELRERICNAAVKLCKQAKYINAGTVEFLLDVETGNFNRSQLRVFNEHTVTEVVTGIDIVRSQILVAQGHKLHDAPIHLPRQALIKTSGYAIQSRITTEDPENQFIPDYGRLTTYRSAGGFGLRLDGGNGFGGAVITPYFDSLLVKLTASGATFDEAVRRSDRCRGIPYPWRQDKHSVPRDPSRIPRFVSGDATTTFIDKTPELFRAWLKGDRATKILSYLGDVIVNGRADVKGKVVAKKEFHEAAVPAYPKLTAPPPGMRNRLLEMGPEKFSQWVRKQKRVLLTDTTMRDAHVAPGDAGADRRPAENRRSGGAPDAGTVQPGNVGRGHF